MRQAVVNCRLLRDGALMADHALIIEDDTIAGIVPAALELLDHQILQAIEKSGAQLLYITDEGVPHRQSAAWHFRCQTLAPGPLFNHVAVMAICHLIATRAIERSGAAGRTRLRGIEAFGDVLEEL